MSKFLLNALLVSPAVFGATLAVSASAFAADATSVKEIAQPQASTLQPQLVAAPEASKTEVAPVFSNAPVAPAIVASTPVEQPAAAPADSDSADSLNQLNRYSREGRAANNMSQVTSVSQLSDVRPTDWAFQALQSLVERYGCIVGYPDRTYRGNRALTRYEFAAGLNACIDRVNELIAAATADLVKKEDLATLQRLQEEFAAELATLRGRVDALEARTATLEKQQFSTTTKLAGEVIFAVTDEFGQNVDNNTVLQNRVRLALNTSFTGRDLLVTRLAAGNATAFNYGTSSGVGALNAPFSEGLQTFNFGNTGNNSVYADWVAYYGNLGENIKFYLPAISGLHYDYAATFSPALDSFDGGTGALSIFGQRNPIYLIGGGSGLAFTVQNPRLPGFTFSIGYLADNSAFNTSTRVGPTTFGANNPSEGLFEGSYSALAQLGYTGGNFGIGLTYVNAYRSANGGTNQVAIFDGGSAVPATGTLLANQNGLAARSAIVNGYGASAYLKLGQNIVLNGFFSYINADFVDDGRDQADIWTYGVGLAFPDLGKKGNLGGLIFGAEPYLGNARELYPGQGARSSTPFHAEAFYKYQLTDNISVTPGVIWIFNPGQNSDNEDIIIGTLRTTFTF
ncbi:iron uptake porin [Leptolyngbya sp. FACHB-36]|uniref:iron uptake porin n=1 Tax=Leptolyngbya sp. FACHB-36 TaxID=2692808 RepID=UPI00168088AF|nr:iron uptake porin [Leptolyngbya sp. FACHB-36]MBD2021657.1 iron uptake porin [Leptolyngbya sp. FACHB-36]